MNVRIRLSDKGSGRYENIVPIESSSAEKYTVSVSKDFTNVKIYDSGNGIVAEYSGTNSHSAIMQAIKNMLVSLNCIFAGDNQIRYSDNIELELPDQQTLEFSAVPTSGAFVLDYDGDLTASISYDATASVVQTALRAISGLENINVTGSIASDMVVSFGGVSSPVTLAEDSNTLQIDAVKLLTFSAVPTSGAFTITYNSNPTSSLAFNASAAQVQTALRLVAGLADVVVTGNFTSGFSIRLVGIASPATLAVGSNTLDAGGAVTTNVATPTTRAAVTLTIS